MEPNSSLTHGFPFDLYDQYRCGYGGAIIPEQVTSQQLYSNTGSKKSKLRLNDQLVPKPTDINIGEKIIKIATPKEHPYSSHISRFAMFPSFHSPDDPETGVRVASQPYPSHLIPKSAPGVTLLSKTYGGPFRHEILETPIKTRKALSWTGQHGFWDHTKPLTGENQVFYPTPPKTVLPNPNLRDWDLSLSERTSNMLTNVERTHWVTTYQRHFTGSGPACPLKIDDFKEKMSGLTGMNSQTVTQRERSYPVFVPAKPRHACRRRQGSGTCSPTAADLLNPSNQVGTATAPTNQHGQQEIPAEHNEAPDLNPKGHRQSENSTEAQRAELSREVSHKQQIEGKSFVYVDGEGENSKVRFDESLMQDDTGRPPDLHNRPLSNREIDVNREKSLSNLCHEPSIKKQHFKVGRSASKHQVAMDSHTELLSRPAAEQGRRAEGRELSRGISNPYVPLRPPALPGIGPVGTAGGENAALRLLDLQNSFSKSAAHRSFNSSITRAAVNLTDNVVTGRKHDFYGINCYYLHG
uniref:Uncharacterized protein n=1 Tax=Scophthalmus maximus TaxID=52904 RepID=A0A8D3BEV2_SCOMX